MPVVEVTTAAEMQSALDSHGGKAVVDFHATWCGPCKNIAPYVKEQTENNGLLLIKVDIDQANALSQEFGIAAMPTFCAIKGKYNNVLLKQTGGAPQVVDKIIAALK